MAFLAVTRLALTPFTGAPLALTPLAVTIDWILFVFAALLGGGAWFIYVWALGDGQFKNVEEPAERLLALDARDSLLPEPSPSSSRPEAP